YFLSSLLFSNLHQNSHYQSEFPHIILPRRKSRSSQSSKISAPQHSGDVRLFVFLTSYFLFGTSNFLHHTLWNQRSMTCFQKLNIISNWKNNMARIIIIQYRLY